MALRQIKQTKISAKQFLQIFARSNKLECNGNLLN